MTATLPASVRHGLVIGPNTAAPVLAGTIVYRVLMLDTNQVIEQAATRNVADAQTYVMTAPVGAAATVTCLNGNCYLFVMGETIVFNECPEAP